MAEAGVALGFSPAQARQLTQATLRGAVRLLDARGDSPAALRRKVTSPGGTTEAALTVMENRRVKEHVVAAIRAAWQRGRELSQ
jgi:pyrroline-5-carboxylate reductase